MDIPDRVDSRQMCFRQGKACIWMTDDAAEIVTELPNGVVMRRCLADDTVVRTWPDGRVERYRKGDPEDLEYPYIPPPNG